jgi:hypothetical protein
VPPDVVSVVQDFRLVAVHEVDDAASPLTNTVAESINVAVDATMVESAREYTDRASVAAGTMRSVSMMVREDGTAPVAATVIVSTYVPMARPAGDRVQRTTPDPVPPADVSVFHAARFVAVHAVVGPRAPDSVTCTESVIPDVLPTAAESRRALALSASTEPPTASTVSIRVATLR